MGSEFCPLSLGWISPLQSSHTSTSLRSDVVRRPLAGGRVRNSLRYSVVYYFGSIFFRVLFLGIFYSRLAPSTEIGAAWPPAGIAAFNPLGVPLLNSIILLTSGVSVTRSHHRVLANNHASAATKLLLTIGLGLYFTRLQALEY